MSAVNSSALLAAAGGDYEIQRSVRLRASASAYFNWTPASAGNRQTWAWSGWVKRGGLGESNTLLSAGFSGSNRLIFNFNATDNLTLTNTIAGALTTIRTTTAVYSDVSAWYHVVLAVDTTQATGTNRTKIYVNGDEVTTFSTSNNFTQNYNGFVAGANAHNIGLAILGATYANFYLTEVNFIDGQALDPSYFGETDAITGVWKPKKYAGTYGTNGFYLNFSDNSAATAAAIGKDYSGNGNNWTPNNISVTAGVTYDSMLDVPTMWADGGNGRGNYFTLNPLSAIGYTPYSDGNLKYTSPGLVAFSSVFTTTGGKWYYECTAGSIATPANFRFGFGALYFANGNIFIGGVVDTVASYTNGDIIGVATDSDANTVSFYKNNVLQGTYSASLNGSMAVALAANAPDSGSFNFGQRPFAYTPPAGFKALNTQNLPEPTIPNGRKFFDTTTYTGNGSFPRTITNSGEMQPDLVWVKTRSLTRAHTLFDSVRGFGLGKELSSDQLLAEGGLNTAAFGAVTSAVSNGFVAGTGSTNGDYVNKLNDTYVGWQWKEGATPGFDIVTYTGDGVANRTVAHNLGVTPGMIIVKARNSSTYSWNSWHKGLTAGYYIGLNTTSPQDNSVSIFPSGGVTSTNWNTGGNAIYNNGSGVNYVAYVFAEVEGFSRFGSYTGNGSANGPFVFCGFRPRFVMVKRINSTGDWNMFDSARNAFNTNGARLWANLASAEGSGDSAYSLFSNGFKLGDVDGSRNASGSTYIFMAFAENPFKNSLAR